MNRRAAEKRTREQLQALRDNGHDAHPFVSGGNESHRIAIRWRGWWWEVVGGDAVRPSLKRLPKDAFPGFTP